MSDEIEGEALATKATRAADAMNIILLGAREVIIDDHRDLLDVNTPREEVRRDQHPSVSCPKLVHNSSAFGGVHGAMSLGDGEVVEGHAVGEGLDATAGGAEDDGLGDVDVLVEVAEGLVLPPLLFAVDVELVYPLQRQFLFFHQYVQRLPHEPPRYFQEFCWQCRREQRYLHCLWEGLEDQSNYFLEFLGQHFVSLVDDEGLDMRGLQGASLNHVEDPTGSPNDDVNPATEQGFVLASGGPASAAVGRDAHVDTQARNDAVDLVGEFPNRHKNKRLSPPEGNLHLLKDPTREGRRLASPRLGLSDQVHPFAHRHYRLLLDH
eukprot:CAMPEP_0174258956 /NCGR_PEP_ID=MMETSP0439-20130205/7864_1 /TAXON_ID=0 /ORGANISM="Stereomyxa ramosa, Strain Chinc5" /LENGTH=321 /DNA_ID=CAMNT_0015342659 /DNA_START=11 /DNA_END=976 /DNA_ORIENTATION=-